MAGHAAARGEDALRRMHAVNVFGAGFGAHQDDVMASAASFSASSAVKRASPVAAPGEARQTHGDLLLRRLGIERGMQQLVERRRIDTR